MHSLRNLLEPSNVSTSDQAGELALGRCDVLLGRLKTVGEAVLHDALELGVDFLGGPDQTCRVLSHLETGDSDAAGVGGFACGMKLVDLFESCGCGTGGGLPGAYHIAPFFFSLRVFSKTSIASCVQPMLLPSAMNLQPAETRASASSPETSFWVALGRATSTEPTCFQGRSFSMYLNWSLYSEALASSERALRLTLRSAMMLTSSGVMPLPSVAINEPLLSERETMVAPSSMALSAAY